jgi:hypothetical protein
MQQCTTGLPTKAKGQSPRRPFQNDFAADGTSRKRESEFTLTARPPKYGPKVIAALVLCWATLGMPTGKRLAPILPELVAILRRHRELPLVRTPARRPDSGKITPKLCDKRSQVTLHELLRWKNFSDCRHGLPHACGPQRPALRQ